MPASLPRFLPLLITAMFVIACVDARADSWVKPTPEELQMTAEPAAPGADAVYLLYDERVDDKLHVHVISVRVKILNDKGKDHADQEIDYEGVRFNVFGVEGRTIHSDGTVIPFTGKPYEKLLEKGRAGKYKATVFTLPDVQTGSILEYRYVLGYQSNEVLPPRWFLQKSLYARKEHFQFLPSDRMIQDEHGKVTQNYIAYSSFLPPGTAIVYAPAGKYYTLDAQNIPALPDEDFMPPLHNFTFRALFYYTSPGTEEQFWIGEGKYWSKEVDRFIDVKSLSSIANQILSPGDTAPQKLHKLYAAVMQLENTSFTREHSTAENKEQGVKVKTALDVWQQKRGNRDEITRLFIGLARSAGFKAYAGFVTDRDRNLFVPDYLERSQLDDEIAIVQVDGKDQFFDPGERYATFGELHWKHTSTQGIRQTEKSAALFETPTPGYQASRETRNADLTIDTTGKVTGLIRLMFTGCRALQWRAIALRNDEAELNREAEATVQRDMPPGIQVKSAEKTRLNDGEHPLMVTFNVTGSMGSATGKRIFLPATFFAAADQPLFVLDKRTTPIDLDYPYALQDSVFIRLPPSFDLESLPKDGDVTFPNNALYRVKFTKDPNGLKSSRILVIGNVLFKAEEYAEVKSFYQKINSKDKEPAVLQVVQTASGGTSPASAGSSAEKTQ